MVITHETFIIAYCGISVPVTPVTNGLDLQYIARLPTREMVIEIFNDDDKVCWMEETGETTDIAKEIGEIIEQKFM